MPTRSDFPTDFAWGVAASAYQIEGGVAEGGRSPSIWDTFSHTPGRTYEGHTGDMGADHYHRFAEDVGIMAELGVNAYRLSLSWPRILPEGIGEVNAGGIDFYRRLCGLLIDNGITPFVTLYHWDLPEILHRRGGWENPESVEWFTEYAVAAKKHLGDLVKVWATFNEPHCTAFLGYSDGVHAPGLTDPGAAYVVAHHLMVAHHRATAAMRATTASDDDRLGIVLNLIPAWAEDSSVEAQTAADGVDAIHNRMFAAAVLDGEYPEVVLRSMERFGVSDRIDIELLAREKVPIDYLGVNYYNVNHIAAEEGAPMIGQWPGADDAVLMRPPGDLTDMDWGVEPVALTWMLNRVTRWAPGLPLYVTENGAAYPDVPDADGVVHDDLRREYIESHIAATHDAMEEGADVRGYFVWSLLDNFEWSHGYRMRFGIVRVDFETMERTVKESGRWYQQFLAGDATIT